MLVDTARDARLEVVRDAVHEQYMVAERDPVAVLELALVLVALALHPGAVAALEIADHEGAIAAQDHTVAAREPAVVHLQRAGGAAADGDLSALDGQHHPRARARED